MEMSIREARARFSEAIEAARRGERVVITRHGEPVAEIGPVQPKPAEDFWERNARVRKKLGLDQRHDEGAFDEDWRKAFDDPAFGRAVFGLDDEDEGGGLLR
jgi:prevent-host-death family protein